MPCIFCQIIAEKQPSAVVYKDAQCMVIMDIFPMSQGHMLLMPLQHYQHIQDMPQDLYMHLSRVGYQINQAVCRSELQPQATNYLVNNGKAANQEVPHVHLHIIPRYSGDSLKTLTKMFSNRLPNKRAAPMDSLQALANSIKAHIQG